jgi:hypothetical protein
VWSNRFVSPSPPRRYISIDVTLTRKQGMLWMVFFESLRTFRHVSHGAKGLLLSFLLGTHFVVSVQEGPPSNRRKECTYADTLVAAPQTGAHNSSVGRLSP